MSTLGRRRTLWLVVGVGTLALTTIGLTAFWPDSQTASLKVHQNTNDRDRYAALYQAAWRQDQGLGSVFMTATLFSPPLISALGRDPNRSDTESELWRAVKDTTENQIAFFLTIDSVAQPVADDAISHSLTVTDMAQTTYHFVSWHPLIVPSRIVNTNATVSSQAGVAAFSADQPVNWSRLADLQLTSRGMSDQPIRTFTWAQPSLVLDVQ